MKLLVLAAWLALADSESTQAPTLDPNPGPAICDCAKWIQTDGGYVCLREICATPRRAK